MNRRLRHPLMLLLFLSFWFLVLSFGFYRTNYALSKPQYPHVASCSNASNEKFDTPNPLAAERDGCVSVYLYDLPPEFNLGLLKDCSHLNIRTNMCPHVANGGLGQPISFTEGSTVASSSSPAMWYATHQFVAEMLFHARLKNHPCRTLVPDRANLFYVPFYGGLHASSKFREANHTARDELNMRLVEFLQKQPWWRRNHGKDHFLTLGRIARDFMRTGSGNDYGANRLLNLPPIGNMSVLIIEKDPWQGRNQHGIPYPSYFHPSTIHQMRTWQKKMRESRRPFLFSFIGAPRRSVKKAAIRNDLIRQCNATKRCELLLCGRGGAPSKCSDPGEVLRVMSRSQFCLQAPGDSFTRRSTFDSMLAGCIPVFFSPHSAYTQYQWYFPGEESMYSVYVEAKNVRGHKSIEEELLKIPSDQVEMMRSRVIDLIPKLTYTHPNATNFGLKDAVDVALEALVKEMEMDANSE